MFDSMFILMFQSSPASWSEIIQYGPTVVILALMLGFLIRVAPMWKEIRLKEIDIRADENVVKTQQASALSELAGALKEIAVEQRRATETIEILQRVNADSNDRLSHTVQSLNERMDKWEQHNAQDVRETVKGLASRMETLEKNVNLGSESATA